MGDGPRAVITLAEVAEKCPWYRRAELAKIMKAK
jgi:hypothetical protein